MTGDHPQSHAPMLFDRTQMRLHRKRAAARLHRHAALFDESAAELLERLQPIVRTFSTILDLGCRNDVVSKQLKKEDPARFIVSAYAAENAGVPLALVLDEEALPFKPASFDLIVSNLALHWINDLPGALRQIRQTLKPDGFFIAALLGGDTLTELRQCLAEAELRLRGGVSPHISPFVHLQDASLLLQRAGFHLPVADRVRLTFTYAHAFELLQELRFMGEGNALVMRDKRILPRAFFIEMAQLYQQGFADSEGRIPATFELLFLAGWTP